MKTNLKKKVMAPIEDVLVWRSYLAYLFRMENLASVVPPTKASDNFLKQFFTCCFDKSSKFSGIRSNSFMKL